MIISFPIMIASYKLLLWLEFHLIAHLELQSRLLLLLWCLVNGLHISFTGAWISFCYPSWGSPIAFTVTLFPIKVLHVCLCYRLNPSLLYILNFIYNFYVMTSIILVMTIISLVDGPYLLSLRLELHLLHPSVEVLLGSPMFRDA